MPYMRLLFVLVFLLPRVAWAQTTPAADLSEIDFWYEDSNMRRGGGYPPDFYEMFTHPEKWAELRSLIDVYYLRAPTLISVTEDYGEEFIRDHFAPVLREADIPVAIDNANDDVSEYLAILQESGLTISHIALQSVLSKRTKGDPPGELSDEMRSRVEKAARRVVELKKAYPDAEIGLIDALPTKGGEYKRPYRLLHELTTEAGHPIDFIQLDAPMDYLSEGYPITWEGAEEVERFVQEELGLGYGFIVTSFVGGMQSDQAFYDNVMNTLDEYPVEGGGPDHFVLMSWYNHPARALPEDAPAGVYPMTKVGLHFARALRGIDATAGSDPNRPNVVMIIGDDQRWTDFSFMGHPVIDTPNIDRLAGESAVFTNGYVPTSLCRPSLASMITGLYPHQHGITGNDPPDGVDRARMLRFIAKAPSLPRTLRQLGYRSMQTGKWWEGHYATGGFTHGMTIDDEEGRHGDHGLDIGREGLAPIYDFIDEGGGQPFFLWYAPLMPHKPHRPPDRLLEKYSEEGRPIELAKYYAMIEWFDETVGELLSYLDDRGLRENTIVLFAVDNGWIQLTEPLEDWDFAFAPRSKRSPYEGGIRTPILIRWPGHVEPGRREALATTLDFAPTVLRAVGLLVPGDMSGLDLVGLAGGDRRRTFIFGEIFTHDAVDLDRPATSLLYRWVRENDWKLVDPVDGPVELYNIARDPHEETNLASSRKSIAERLQHMLGSWWDPETLSVHAATP